ncbi:LOW QUALITY PROTEIN: hypothetical protein HID58_087787 [Brassica napus]|uniref:Uncharacterized protein n=1 Tax=Brassica napus TaxID=3708 RepID=A0ABQ7XWU3_BRANA|nr:LOW QUALITY PROTEIN: hypothetical protein HID58_087787 [Brassica napus]
MKIMKRTEERTQTSLSDSEDEQVSKTTLVRAGTAFTITSWSAKAKPVAAIGDLISLFYTPHKHFKRKSTLEKGKELLCVYHSLCILSSSSTSGTEDTIVRHASLILTSFSVTVFLLSVFKAGCSFLFIFDFALALLGNSPQLRPVTMVNAQRENLIGYPASRNQMYLANLPEKPGFSVISTILPKGDMRNVWISSSSRELRM